jgi:hypothetical protein
VSSSDVIPKPEDNINLCNTAAPLTLLSLGAVPGPEDDVSIEGWNSLGDAYTLRYVKDGDAQARPVVLSMLVVGDKLLVDTTRLGGQGEVVHNLELK